MGDLHVQSQDARPLGQDLSDGRGGGNETAPSAMGPRYLYYRIYTTYGAIKSNNPIYANDPFISRTLSRLITPPHTALLVKNHLLKIEGFARTTNSNLFESLSSQTAIEDNATRLSIWDYSGPGVSENEPVALVVEAQDVEKRSASSRQGKELPNANLREPRYLYYRIYDQDGAMASKTSFDPDDDFLGRIDTLSVAPPRTAASLEAYITNIEAVASNNIQLFEDTRGETPVNDGISLLSQVYLGSRVDEPIAIVCWEAPQVNQRADPVDPVVPTFSVPIRVKRTCSPSEANLPAWLPIIAGETLHIESLTKTTNMAYIGGKESCNGYIAINSVGQKGFVRDYYLDL